MKCIVIFLAFFLLNCADFVPKESNYSIVVHTNGLPVPHGNRLRCGGGDERCKVTIQFSFADSLDGTHGTPMVYVYGDGYLKLNKKRLITNNTYELNRNITYEGFCELKQAGTMSILFAWVYDRRYVSTHLIHVDNF